MKQHGTGPLEAWRGVSPRLVLSDLRLQLGTNTRLQNLPLLGPSLAQLRGEPPEAEPAGLLKAACALPPPPPPQAAFDQRMKTWQRWQDAQATLQKKREAEARLLWANKPDKLQQAKDEIVEVRPLRQLWGGGVHWFLNEPGSCPTQVLQNSTAVES